jgi:ABC-2 type transport system permease protein
MKGFTAALSTECLKAYRSRVFWVTVAVFAFISIMIGVMVYFSVHPELLQSSTLMRAKATILGQSVWRGYFGLMYQMASMLGLIGFGFVAGWIFGREYSDRTIKDLLALPVTRTSIVIAKFVVMIVWSLLLAVVMFLLGLAAGLLIHLGGWPEAAVPHALSVFMVTSALTVLVSFPVAFFAGWGKGYLLPIAYILLTMIFTQIVISGFPGLGPYFPWAVPALYSGAAGPGNAAFAASYVIIGLAGLAGIAGTLVWWRFADHK